MVLGKLSGRSNQQLVDEKINVVFFLLGDSPESEFDMPTFRNTLFHLHRIYEDRKGCSETLAHTIQTQGNHPKERIQHKFQ